MIFWQVYSNGIVTPNNINSYIVDGNVDYHPNSLNNKTEINSIILCNNLLQLSKLGNLKDSKAEVWKEYFEEYQTNKTKKIYL